MIIRTMPVRRLGWLAVLSVGTMSVGGQTAPGQSAAGGAAVADRDASESQPIETAEFRVQAGAGTLTSLRRTGDAIDTQYVAEGRRLGDVLLAYRRAGTTDWVAASTAATPPQDGDAEEEDSEAGGRITEASWRFAGPWADSAPDIELRVRFTIHDDAILWTINLRNLSSQSLEVGDLGLPLPMTAAFDARRGSPPVMKHHFISGHGSFMFWARAGEGPSLVLTPLPNTPLEYWEPPQRRGGRQARDASPKSAFRAFIHSAASGANARQRGTQWRQPRTSLTLAAAGEAGDSVEYGFKLRWSNDLDGVRDVLVDERLVDVQVVPGMTVPSDLAAVVALRTHEPINRIEAEFPDDTEITPRGKSGDYQLYEIRLRRLGENRLAVNFGNDRHVYLEFFSTEPVETLIKKRAAFLARSQHHDPTKWYRGLISDWNMETQVLLGPDNYDRISGFRIYAVTCDDPGLAKPAFLAAKNAEYPDADEIAALDEYIEHFVWGGLQRTTEETYPYGIYGIQDWKRNRESDDRGRDGRLHIWRCYDYPHIVLLYHSMYRAAKAAPHISTRLAAEEYLRRAAGTALALFTVPREVEGWSAYGTGFYNELVIVDLIRDLAAAGMHDEATALRDHWERKVRRFVLDNPDLFRSEYPFDSTGFESTHALAKYAVLHAEAADGEQMGVSPAAAREFMDRQMAANLFCRGSIEPAYYYLGSDYRGGGGNGYTLTYMSQMGGWAVLDYGLHVAKKNRDDYLRLGYASILSAWALVNSGTPTSNFGYWYPGEPNDGAAGGGFEPAPFGMTWLGQPHHRGAWYYACESDLGFSGALRAARCVVTDDPVFGRICLGGELTTEGGELKVVPKDGLRRRLHVALETGELHVELDGARFVAGAEIELADDGSRAVFAVESANPNAHAMRLQVASAPGRYRVTAAEAEAGAVDVAEGKFAEINVTIPGGSEPTPVVLERIATVNRE